jgi:hypothetical protein
VSGFRSHLALLKGGGNSVQRWWFVPFYDGLYASADGLAFELTGQRAQLLSQDEWVNAAGERAAAATTRLSTQAFARQFTDHFSALADESPVFGQLQGLIDWCVIAGLLSQEPLEARSGCSLAVLRDAERWPHAAFTPPRQVPAMWSRKRSGNLVIGLVAGGVTIDARQVLQVSRREADAGRRLESLRLEHRAKDRPDDHPWWWD